MLHNLIYSFLFLAFFALTPLSVNAQSIPSISLSTSPLYTQIFDEPRNSTYYLRDGKFTDAEKDEEALYVYQKCSKNVIQSQFFDCSCVSGSFRNHRDSEKIIPQSHIISSIYKQKNTPCINVPEIAGKTYSSCMENSKYYHESSTQEQNNKYCTCLANRSASDFKKEPKLDLRYFNKVKAKAARVCNTIYKR